VGRQVHPEGGEEPFQSRGHDDAADDTDGRGHEPDDERLGQNRPGDLLPAGAERPEQGEFPESLGHDDREGVENDERADEERDGGEGQQEGVEEAQCLLHVAGGLVGGEVAGDRFDPVGQCRPEPGHQVGPGDALRRLDGDLVELAETVEHPLSSGHVPQDERRAGQVVG
jgi:hypothetical protein